MRKSVVKKSRALRNGRGNAEMMRFLTVTIMLVLVIAGLCVETVKCRNDVSAQEMECYYAEKEQELVEETRALLKAEGYENSGVMLTRVVEADGSRCYTLTVHHGRINALSAQEQQELLEKLAELNFEEEQITFFHEFLASR